VAKLVRSGAFETQDQNRVGGLSMSSSSSSSSSPPEATSSATDPPATQSKNTDDVQPSSEEVEHKYQSTLIQYIIMRRDLVKVCHVLHLVNQFSTSRM